MRSVESGPMPERRQPNQEAPKGDELLEKLVAGLPEDKQAHFKALIEKYSDAGNNEALNLAFKLLRLSKQEGKLSAEMAKTGLQKPEQLKMLREMRQEISATKGGLKDLEAGDMLKEILATLKVRKEKQ